MHVICNLYFMSPIPGSGQSGSLRGVCLSARCWMIHRSVSLSIEVMKMTPHTSSPTSSRNLTLRHMSLLSTQTMCINVQYTPSSGHFFDLFMALGHLVPNEPPSSTSSTSEPFKHVIMWSRCRPGPHDVSSSSFSSLTTTPPFLQKPLPGQRV